MPRHSRFAVCIFALVLALAGCGGKHAADARGNAAELPAPEAGKGAVTGMPDTPGPGAIGTPAPPAPATMADADASDATPLPEQDPDVAVGAADPAAPTATPIPPGNASEPEPGDAVQLLRDYYAAIDAHDYAHAYGLWAENGRASRQSPRQFADGFADTRDVGIDIGTPGDEDAGAGQRYIEIPATVTAVHADGSRHRYVGSYTLHRTVVDGASAEERAWRISRANLREAAP